MTELSTQLKTSVRIGEHACAQMQGDLDRQRLLGERPLSEPLDIVLKQMQHKERYEFCMRLSSTVSLGLFKQYLHYVSIETELILQ